MEVFIYMARSHKKGYGGPPPGGVFTSTIFTLAEAPVKRGYTEALLLHGRGRRGRVLADKGEELEVEFYDTGDKEMVERGKVSTQWRET